MSIKHVEDCVLRCLNSAYVAIIHSYAVYIFLCVCVCVCVRVCVSMYVCIYECLDVPYICIDVLYA